MVDRTAALGTCATALTGGGAPGLAFDPVAKQVVGYPASAGDTIYVMDMDLSNFTCTTETYAGGPVSELGDGSNHPIRGHFRYSAKEDAFILAYYPFSNVLYLRRRAQAISGPLQDFQNRCAAPGVILCQGFDSAAAIGSCNTFSYNGSGLYNSSDGTGTCPTLDTTTSRSGGGSLLFTVPSMGGSDTTGSWRQLFDPVLTDTDARAAKFSPPGAGGTNGNHFYIQFSQKMDTAFITNNWNAAGTWWKQEIFANYQSSCGSYELTTINQYNNGYPTMYSNCGSQNFYEPGPGGDQYHEQGDTSTTGYNCLNNSPTPQTCFYYPPNTWMTFYYDITLNSTGSADSVVRAYVSVNGSPYKEWINIPNFTQGSDTPNYYDMVYLFPYMTDRNSGINVGPVSHTWYDELIISSQPIAAPSVPPSN